MRVALTLVAFAIVACPVARAAAPGLPPDAADAAKKIIDTARAGDGGWGLLADLCDRVGSRLAGSPSYARAALWAKAEATKLGLENVHGEDVTFARWIRGAEQLTLLEPGTVRELPLLALGRTIGTPAEGITGTVLVVRDFDELEKRKDEVKGRVVVYNFPMRSGPGAYGEAVAYRTRGASRAAKHGALAALVRSVTTLAVRAPHTGVMGYEDGAPQIPTAAITIEDAELMARLQERGTPAKLRLVLGAKDGGPVTDANVVAELRGRERPDEVVIIGGHLDSWDVGCGAHDDGAGVVTALAVARTLRDAGLRPRRTVRVVLFANEEFGGIGGKAYLAAHKAEMGKVVAALESDSGGFRPTGFTLDGDPAAVERAAQWMTLFAPLGDVTLKAGGSGADIGGMGAEGVPAFGVGSFGEHYFDYHHSPLDTVDKVDVKDLRDATASWALMTWLLAEAPEPLVRKAPVPPPPATTSNAAATSSAAGSATAPASASSSAPAPSKR